MATKVTWKPRKGETLVFKRRNGTTGTGKFVEIKNMGRGDWYVLKVTGMRKPEHMARFSELSRPT